MHYNCHQAAVSDEITDALSYQTAYEIIAREMMKRSHLLEHVGAELMGRCLICGFPSVAVCEDQNFENESSFGGGQISFTSVTLEK
ncbi:MAG: dihydroneopterin aldolase [Odoribacter sp.]